MKITLYLMSKKGYKVLEALINNNYTSVISEVIYGRDSNVKNDYANDIAKLSSQYNIPCFDRKHNKIAIKSLYSIAISWRWLIKETKSSLIVVHDSLLPDYRGFSPLVNMLINEEKCIGVTALFATEEYDKGDIIYKSKTNIRYPIKIKEAIDIIIDNYIDVVLRIFKTLTLDEKLPRIKQNETKASYSLWRGEEDYHIDWNKNSKSILNFINAVSYPYKGAFTYVNNKKIRILEAEIRTDVSIKNRDCGKVIFIENKYPVIVCRKGLLKITKAIYEISGKNALPLDKFRIKLK